MAVKQQQCFTVTCDVCAKPFEDAYGAGLIVHFDSEAEALSEVEIVDWHTGINGHVICDAGDAVHEAAIRVQHEAGMELGHWCWVRAQDEDAADLALVQTRAAADNGNRTPLADVLAEHGMTEADMETTA